jgi:hypothetical protein
MKEEQQAIPSSNSRFPYLVLIEQFPFHLVKQAHARIQRGRQHDIAVV